MEIGTLWLERYRVLEPLGEGGFSKVVKAFDTKMEREVAVKIIPTGRKTAVRALREAKTVALLNHPNIVTLYEFDEGESYYTLIMEYVEGWSLADVLDKFERLPVQLVLAIGVQICEALECAHANDVIHRDIKPGNLRVMSDGRVKVMDFGIARLRSAAKTSSLTTEGELVGTFAYMSPEQAGGEVVDERSDIFSMGVLLYEMITGRLPFIADTPAGTIYKILNEEPPAPEKVNPLVPPALGQTIMRAMSKFPEDRFARSADLKGMLERCRQSTDAPQAVVKELIGKLKPAKVESTEGPLTAIRRRLGVLVDQYSDTITVTAYASGAALIAFWSGNYLPFLHTELKVFIPAAIFFSALFVPSLGLALLLALISAGIWEISPYLGAVAAAGSVVYWITLGRGFPQIAFLPFLVPALAWLKTPFVFPLAVGLVFGPVLSPFLGGLGALTLALAELLGQLDYVWTISAQPELIRKVHFNATGADLIGLLDYFKAQPWLLAQVGIWAAAGSIVSLIRTVQSRFRHLMALVFGTAVLWLSYHIAPGFLSVDYRFGPSFVQPMVFSLIMLLSLMFVFFRPDRD